MAYLPGKPTAVVARVNLVFRELGYVFGHVHARLARVYVTCGTYKLLLWISVMDRLRKTRVGWPEVISPSDIMLCNSRSWRPSIYGPILWCGPMVYTYSGAAQYEFMVSYM